FRPTAEGRPAMSSTPVAGGEITGATVTDPTAPPTATDPVTTGPGTEGTAVPSTVDQLPSNVIETPPRAGDCFGAMTNVNGRWAGERVPCTEPHVWEAYAVGELDPTTPSSNINDVTVDPVV